MINKSILVGRLTKDPELRHTQAGVAVCSFTLAVNRTFTNQDGEREVDFINCVAWKHSAENLARFIKKGGLIGLEGRIQTRNYDQDDGHGGSTKIYVTEVVAENIQFLEPKKQEETSYNNPSNNASVVDGMPDKGIDVDDRDLPF